MADPHMEYRLLNCVSKAPGQPIPRQPRLVSMLGPRSRPARTGHTRRDGKSSARSHKTLLHKNRNFCTNITAQFGVNVQSPARGRWKATLYASIKALADYSAAVGTKVLWPWPIGADAAAKVSAMGSLIIAPVRSATRAKPRFSHQFASSSIIAVSADGLRKMM
jgi:hypothetical protein